MRKSRVRGVSIFKRGGRDGRGDPWVLSWTEGGKRRWETVGTDYEAAYGKAMELSRRLHREKAGLVTDRERRDAANAARPLAEHLTAFRAKLGEEGRDPKYARQTHAQAAAVLLLAAAKDVGAELSGLVERSPNAGKLTIAADRAVERAGALRLADVTPSGVRRAVAAIKDRGFGPVTANRYLKAAKAFYKWMDADERAGESPVRHLKAFNEKLDVRRVRRAVTLEEVQRLIEAAHGGPAVLGMTGPERAALYQLCIAAGLRAGEARALRVSDVREEGGVAFVVVRPQEDKARKPRALPIRRELLDVLSPFMAGKMPEAPLFRVPEKTAAMLRHDLEAAGIPYKLDGKVFDFHSLRFETGTLLLAAGETNLKVIQERMRHSTITLTMDRYAQAFAADQLAAADRMPVFPGGCAGGGGAPAVQQIGSNSILPGPDCSVPVRPEASPNFPADTDANPPGVGASDVFDQEGGNAPSRT